MTDFCILDLAKDGVIFQQMSTCLGIRGDIDSDNLNACIGTPAQPTTHKISPNSAKSIYRNTQGHLESGQTAGSLAADHTDMSIMKHIFHGSSQKKIRSHSSTKRTQMLEKNQNHAITGEDSIYLSQPSEQL